MQPEGRGHAGDERRECQGGRSMTDARQYRLERSTFRHNVAAADTHHALKHRVGDWPIEAEPPDRSDDRILAIGPGRDGQLLEVIYVPAHTEYRVIHSMRLRPGTRAEFL